jgi:hypothetical protein
MFPISSDMKLIAFRGATNLTSRVPSSPVWALVSHFCLANKRHTPLPYQHLLLGHITINIKVRKPSHTTHVWSSWGSSRRAR